MAATVRGRILQRGVRVVLLAAQALAIQNLLALMVDPRIAARRTVVRLVPAVCPEAADRVAGLAAVVVVVDADNLHLRAIAK